MSTARIGAIAVAMMLMGGCGGDPANQALLTAEATERAMPPASWACQGKAAAWHETRAIFRVPNGRVFGVSGAHIATEFVCAGVVRWDDPETTSSDMEVALADLVTQIERQYQTVASKLTYPESAPRSFCVALSNTVNFALGDPPVFRLQKAYAVLDTGELVSATPAPLHEIHRIRPTGVAVGTVDERGVIVAPNAPDPFLLRWLEPSEPLLKCEDIAVRGAAQ